MKGCRYPFRIPVPMNTVLLFYWNEVNKQYYEILPKITRRVRSTSTYKIPNFHQAPAFMQYTQSLKKIHLSGGAGK